MCTSKSPHCGFRLPFTTVWNQAPHHEVSLHESLNPVALRTHAPNF
nr:MAG TPA: hypothetical protein [Bacteriophage sp.]